MFSATEQLIAYLTELGYRASTQPPLDADEFVTVERTSSSVTNLVDNPTFAIQTWAATEPRAEEMALAIRESLLTGARPHGFHSISAQGVYPFWDESTRLPRYQLVIDCTSQLTE